MQYNDALELAYEDYFGKKNVEISKEIDKPTKTLGSIKNEKLCADGNINSINRFGDELRMLLNTIWGSNWGDLSPESSGGVDHNNVAIPSIRYSTNLREVSEGRSPKPTLTDEIIDEQTGEAVRVYRQTFDCIIEFNIRSSTSKGCSELAEKFEDAMIFHSGYLKKKGISEIFFLKEVPARYSTFFVENIPTKCYYYFVRVEKIKTVSLSTLKEIEAQLDLIGEHSDNSGIGFSIHK